MGLSFLAAVEDCYVVDFPPLPIALLFGHYAGFSLGYMGITGLGSCRENIIFANPYWGWRAVAIVSSHIVLFCVNAT